MSDSQQYNRLLNLFYSKYLKGHNNLKGLILNASMNDEGNIIIDISNPNDLSYGPDTVVGYMEELVHNFTKFINGTGTQSSMFSDNSIYGFISKSLIVFIDGEYVKDITEVYLNKQDLSDVMSRCNTIHEFELEEFWSKCKVSLIGAYPESGEGINVELKVTLLTPEWEGQPLRDMAILTDKIREILEYDSASDYEHSFASPVMSFFWNNPLIIDKEYMWTAPILTFYTPGGKRIRPWS